VTDDILDLVPNHESFKLALRAIKLWAKKRGIYSNVMGYMGGVSWAMLVARTCQLYPYAAAGIIVQKFFTVFVQWPWPRASFLRENKDDPGGNLNMPVWDPQINPSDRYHIMPIITPSYPQQNSTFNVTRSTKEVMMSEFERGKLVTDEIVSKNKEWKELFEPIQFFQLYNHFLALISSSQPEWVGLVESKIRHLVTNLEKHDCIELAHVNPKSNSRIVLVAAGESASGSGETLWFIGLMFEDGDVKVDSTNDIKSFRDTVLMSNRKYPADEIKIAADWVRRKDLTAFLPLEVIGSRTKAAE
jgi:poly(A) polymerase